MRSRTIKLAALRQLAWFYLNQLKGIKASQSTLDSVTTAYLSKSNPILRDLRERYDRVPKPAHSCWGIWEKCLNLQRFRSESNFLSQGYFINSLDKYRLAAAYAEIVDRNGWLASLSEDALFGVKLWQVRRDFRISRDLLDSVLELYFLQDALRCTPEEDLRVLDLGAGYGRFAHRFVHAFTRARITCVDAIATSTFLCEFYLRYRNCPRTTVVPFDKMNSLRAGEFNIATSIFFWGEVGLSWVRFWLDLLVDLNIPYLLLVPNFPDFRTVETNASFSDFGPELARHGFQLVTRRRKYHLSALVDSQGAFPAEYFLFARTKAGAN